MSFPVLTYYVLNKLKPSFRGTVKGISSSHLSQLCWGLSHHICAAIKVGVFQVTHREKLESWHLSASSSRFFLTLLNEDSIVSSSQQGRKARATVDSFLHDASSWCFWLCLLNGRWRLSNNLNKRGIYVLFLMRRLPQCLCWADLPHVPLWQLKACSPPAYPSFLVVPTIHFPTLVFKPAANLISLWNYTDFESAQQVRKKKPTTSFWVETWGLQETAAQAVTSAGAAAAVTSSKQAIQTQIFKSNSHKQTLLRWFTRSPRCLILLSLASLHRVLPAFASPP